MLSCYDNLWPGGSPEPPHAAVRKEAARHLVEGWREDLDRHQKSERAALGKAHADSARRIERQVREASPKRAFGTRSAPNARPCRPLRLRGVTGGTAPRQPLRGTREVWPRGVCWLSRLSGVRQARPRPPRARRRNEPGGHPLPGDEPPRTQGRPRRTHRHRHHRGGSRDPLADPPHHHRSWRFNPRTRGEHGKPVLGAPERVRFIPARAGNTSWPTSSCRSSPVHPRTRGEHGGRGHHGRGDHRFIPARAGNTDQFKLSEIMEDGSSPHARGTLRSSGDSRCSTPVHPRTRGEHHGRPDLSVPQDRFIPARAGNTVVTRATRSLNSGSSPHARGTPVGQVRLTGNHRFIPARAGNTSNWLSAAAMAPVHPRTRGEHSPVWVARSVHIGSSPHARGTHIVDGTGCNHGRFIPARAGNTGSSSIMATRSSVHPRTRGEHSPVTGPTGGFCGSSPHARGTLRRHVGHRRNRRFIPARAGNTWVSGRLRALAPVHPRTRGEHICVLK